MIKNHTNHVQLEIHLSSLKLQLMKSLEEIEQLIEEELVMKNHNDLEKIENKIVNKTDKLASLILSCKIQESLNTNNELRRESADLISAFPQKMKNQGIREVEICPLKGDPFIIKTEYFSQKEKKDKRKKKRTGCYPSLILLGIFDGCTPLLSSDITLMVTALCSLEEAQTILHERGRDLNIKTIRNISNRYAERSRIAQLTESDEFIENIAGCRIVISTDGGRIRIREKKRGPKTKKGRNHYNGAWREPKVLIIYTVGENGRMERSFAPLIDGTLKGPDVIFSMIRFYLEKIGISKADKVMFVADGARWIWNRVEKLMRDIGVRQWYELLDYYHAVEHLVKISELQKGLNKKAQKKWVKKNRNLLLMGKASEVIEEIRLICKGKKSKKLRTERDYFIRNQQRLCYEQVKKEDLPIGSGAVESAIRRVVNLRLKSASTYWLRETAEGMLMLRSYFKSGRWDMLKRLAFSSKTSIER